MNTLLTSLNKKNISLKAELIAVLFGIVSAISLPQLFHIIGAASGVGSGLGEIFLPMHLPVIFIGLVAGRRAGALVGFFSPLVSFCLTAMPNVIVLPFMMLELFGYGFFTGLMKNTKAPVILKVAIAQILGRAVRFVAICAAFYIFDYTKILPSSVFLSVPRALVGILLQLILLPLLMFRLNNDR